MECLLRLPLDLFACLHVLLRGRVALLFHAEHPGLAGLVPYTYAGIGFIIVAGLIGLAICSFLEREQAPKPLVHYEEEQDSASGTSTRARGATFEPKGTGRYDAP